MPCKRLNSCSKTLSECLFACSKSIVWFRKILLSIMMIIIMGILFGTEVILWKLDEQITLAVTLHFSFACLSFIKPSIFLFLFFFSHLLIISGNCTVTFFSNIQIWTYFSTVCKEWSLISFMMPVSLYCAKMTSLFQFSHDPWRQGWINVCHFLWGCLLHIRL